MFKSMVSSFFNQFAPRINKPRNRFTDPYSTYRTIKCDYIYPVFVKQYNPGDTVRGDISAFGRVMTLLRPIYDQLQLDLYAFECPNRILWPHWSNMMGVRRHRDDSINYSVPMGVHTTAIDQGSIAAHMGWPIGRSGITGSCLPYRMYNMMWNQYFRHEDLQEPIIELDGDAPESISGIYDLKKACKMGDYFTNAMVDTQKGDEVLLPLGDTAPTIGNSTSLGLRNNNPSDDTFGLYTVGGQVMADEGIYGQDVGHTVAPPYDPPDTDDQGIGVSTNPATSGLQTILSDATAATINELRQAFQYQIMRELDQRYGSRINELIYGHFGVDIPDAQSQRVRYIGGTSCKMSGQPVAQTYRSDSGETPQGHLTGIGTFNSQGGSFTKTFVEWSIVMVVAVVRAPLHYQQGLARMWRKSTREEFIWPELCELGPEPIYNYEIYCDGTPDDDEVFAYRNRYDSERMNVDIIGGLFNSSNATPLDSHHLAEEFATRPEFNETFIESNTPIERVIAITDEDHVHIDIRIDLTEDRILPLYGNPMQLSRF